MKTTRIYEDNAGQIFAVVMSNGDTVKVVSGIERATDYTLGDIISDAIDGFDDWDGEDFEPQKNLEELADDIRHYSDCVADIEVLECDGCPFELNVTLFRKAMGIAAESIFDKNQTIRIRLKKQ